MWSWGASHTVDMPRNRAERREHSRGRGSTDGQKAKDYKDKIMSKRLMKKQSRKVNR